MMHAAHPFPQDNVSYPTESCDTISRKRAKRALDHHHRTDDCESVTRRDSQCFETLPIGFQATKNSDELTQQQPCTNFANDICNVQMMEAVGLESLMGRCNMTMLGLKYMRENDFQKADLVLENARAIQVSRGLEAYTLSQSCAFLDTLVIRAFDKTRGEEDISVVCVDAYGNFDKFFPGKQARQLFCYADPESLTETLHPHWTSPEVQDTLMTSSRSGHGTLHTVTHGTAHGPVHKINMTPVATWWYDDRQCTLVKECFWDVTDAVRLAEQNERQDRMRHDVRNKIDLARCYLEEEEGNVEAAKRILASISSTIRYTEGSSKVERQRSKTDAGIAQKAYDVCGTIRDAAKLLLEGYSYSFDVSPDCSEWSDMFLSIPKLTFECGVLNEIFINVRKHADISKPVHMEATCRTQEKMFVLTVTNECRRITPRHTCFVSTKKGRGFLKRLIDETGGNVETKREGHTFTMIINIPLEKNTEAVSPVNQPQPFVTSLELRRKGWQSISLRNKSDVADNEIKFVPQTSILKSTTSDRKEKQQPNPVGLEKDFRFCIIEDDKLFCKLWQRALQKRGLPKCSFFSMGSDANQLILAHHRNSAFARFVLDAIKDGDNISLVLDNYLGFDENDVEHTGPSLLLKLREQEWFCECEKTGLLHTCFHTGNSASMMKDILDKQNLGGLPIFEKGSQTIEEKISSILKRISITHS